MPTLRLGTMTSRRPWSSLTHKITLTYVMLGAVILVGVGALAYETGRSALEDSTVDGLSAEALEKERALDLWVAQKISDIQTLASSPYLSGELAALLTAVPRSPESRRARDRLTVLPKLWVEVGRKFLSMSVIHADTGRVLASTDPREIGKFNEDRPYFVNGKLGAHVQNPFYSVPLKAPSIVFSAPIRRPDGDVIGVIVGTGDMDAMRAIIERRSRDRDASDNYIVNAAGLYVTQPRYFADSAALRFSSQSEFVGNCLKGNSGVALVEDYRDVPVIAVYRWIAERGFCLIAKVDQAEAFAPIRTFRNAIVLIGLGTLAVASLIAIGLARTITGPVRALQAGAARIGRGELDVRLPERRRDELGMLAREFNVMAGALCEKQAALARSTGELQRANADLANSNTAMETEIAVRRQAEQKAQAQLGRLNLLHQITRAISERQDLNSIFQVVVRSLEDQLPVDFVCLCLYERGDHALTVARVGVKSGTLALSLAMPERARVEIDENGLSRCVRGTLVYEPDIAEVDFPFPRRLAQGGLRSMVAAPLQVESQVFGVLLVARIEARAFGSGECEFLRQLSEHVALAAHQAQLYGALQQAYDDLRQTQQAVMQQERLRALGQMASGIAHDINNALSPAALYTESLLETETTLSARARQYLETIQRAVDDVAHTVARMKDFYRQREPQLDLVPVHVNNLVQHVVDLTRARWSDMPMQRGIVIRVVTELADDPPAIMGVESEIREALINLVMNAVDAMPNGGIARLRTRISATGNGASERTLHVEVVDDGVGMDEETRRRCLEPFFTTKGERGTGLGLAMVYGVARRNNAEIEFESAPEQGTTVRLSFPVPELVSTITADVPAAPAVPRRLRLLVVDDDPLLLKSMRDILEADGHVVVTANDGQAGIVAFRAAHERGEAFAAVITDLGMPYTDGRKVAGAVKAASPSTPVILLTGWGQRLLADDEVPAHVDRVLSKPARLRELRETLAQCCRPTAQ